MQVKGAIYVGNAGPIPVYAHWSAAFLVVLAFLWTPDLQNGIACLIALALAIVLHELGHAAVAWLFKHRQLMVLLWGMGGIMIRTGKGSQQPLSHGREIAVTAAGPGVNYLLAAIAGGAMYGLRTYAPDLLRDDQGVETIWAIQLYWLVAVNLLLAIFNSLPLFPLDGGHIAYGLLRLMRVADAGARKACVALAIATGVGVIAFDVWLNGQPDLFIVVLIVFLISQSIQWLKAPTP